MSFQIPEEVKKFLLDHYRDLFLNLSDVTIAEAMQIIRSQVVASNKRSVTNLKPGYFETSGFSFSYSYTRQNLSFSTQPKLGEIYPGIKTKKEPSFSTFHTSCQSAIASLFIALSQLYPRFHLASPLRPYFETPLALKLLNKGNEADDGIKFLLIDSTCFEPNHIDFIRSHLDEFELVIIDTSLWVWNEKLFQDALDTVIQKKNIFIVRSHLKLDCLGGEYSSLGSLVFINSEDAISTEVETMINHLKKASSSIGSYPLLDQIFPFYKFPDFHKLTIDRTKEIQSSIDRIIPQVEHLIDQSKIILEKPYHRLFFLMHLKSNNKDLKMHILKFVHLDSGPLQYVDSYGFDFPSVLVSNVRDHSDEYFIRINGHNLGFKMDDQVIDTIKNIIHVANSSATTLP